MKRSGVEEDKQEVPVFIDEDNSESYDDDFELSSIRPYLKHTARIKSANARRRYESIVEERHLQALLYDDFDYTD